MNLMGMTFDSFDFLHINMFTELSYLMDGTIMILEETTAIRKQIIYHTITGTP